MARQARFEPSLIASPCGLHWRSFIWRDRRSFGRVYRTCVWDMIELVRSEQLTLAGTWCSPCHSFPRGAPGRPVPAGTLLGTGKGDSFGLPKVASGLNDVPGLLAANGLIVHWLLQRTRKQSLVGLESICGGGAGLFWLVCDSLFWLSCDHAVLLL